jgi:two-component system, OmpR family, phosphate regulon sensor histidine kinase PhoR
MNLSQFADVIRHEREALLSNWRGQVRQLPSAQGLDTPTLTDHIPSFLGELADAFDEKSDQTIAESAKEVSPQIHGMQRLIDGFDISSVVAEYNILRGCIHDLATAHEFSLQGQPFHILNRVFDKSIGTALETYSSHQARQIRGKREEYLSFVMHDLRTPLFAISLAARVLEKKLPVTGYTKDAAQMVKSLQRSAHQLEELVRKVLDENVHLETEEGVRLQPREFHVWPLIEALMEELHPVAAANGVSLVNAVPDELLVYSDAGALKRVFQNLFANAIRHAPNGTVTISGTHWPNKKGVEFSIHDDGSGISEDIIQNIFDKGETNGHEGDNGDVAGLGLSIVKQLVYAHDGSVIVQSTVGEGSNFLVSLPNKT